MFSNKKQFNIYNNYKKGKYLVKQILVYNQE